MINQCLSMKYRFSCLYSCGFETRLPLHQAWGWNWAPWVCFVSHWNGLQLDPHRVAYNKWCIYSTQKSTYHPDKCHSSDGVWNAWLQQSKLCFMFTLPGSSCSLSSSACLFHEVKLLQVRDNQTHEKGRDEDAKWEISSWGFCFSLFDQGEKIVTQRPVSWLLH